MMPLCNFQDTVSAKILYGLFLQKDSNGNVFDFITHDMLNMGSFLEEEDDDEPENQSPQQQQPFQPIQITQGSLCCAQAIVLDEKELPVTPRVFGSFINDTYRFQLSSTVFHPPAATA